VSVRTFPFPGDKELQIQMKCHEWSRHEPTEMRDLAGGRFHQGNSARLAPTRGETKRNFVGQNF